MYVLRVLSSAAHGDRKTLNSRFDNVHSRPILVPGCQRILPQARFHLVPFRGLGVVEGGCG